MACALTGALGSELSISTWRDHKVLRLSGRIDFDEGLAEKFKELARKVPSLPHGLPVLLLDSPGGSVDEAFKLSKLLDQTPFHTVIPNGAKCASACASIVFIAGKYRTVEPFGLLGQHSCANNGRPSKSCNHKISQHAVDHGVSYGSIAAFVTYFPPSDMEWFSREDSDGWGLTRYPGELESGFEKSEPLVIKTLLGRLPSAQAAWRLDFREDGLRAFLRPSYDHEREMQLNLFCNESLKGRLFLGMEIHGSVEEVSAAVLDLTVRTDLFDWTDTRPVMWAMDKNVTEIVTEIPKRRIIDFLTKANDLEFRVELQKPYQPMIAKTLLSTSRKVLISAANHCPSGQTSGRKAPLQ